MNEKVMLSVDNVSKKFCRDLKHSLFYGVKDIFKEISLGTSTSSCLREHEFWAVRGIKFELNRGECLGLIGANGSGKSTLLKLLNGLIKPDTGSITITGRVGALIELGAGFNPVLSGRENIYVNGTVLGLSKSEIDHRIDRIIDFSGIPEFIEMPVQSYSTGMKVRLGFAIASQLEPDVLLVDEVLAVGDTSFQRKCLARINEYISNGGTVVLVSHDMNLIQSIATKSLLIEHGKARFFDDVNQSIGLYLDNSSNEQKAESGVSIDGQPGLSIESVTVRNQASNEVYPDQDIYIDIHYRSSLERQQVSVGFSIWEPERGIRITTSNSAWKGRLYDIDSGKGKVSCCISNLPLVPGRYSVRAGFYDPDTSWPVSRLGWDDKPESFVIHNNAETGLTRQSIARDLIRLDGVSWK